MGELVFVCSWPVWVSLARRRGEARPDGGRWGEGFLHFHSLSWGVRDLLLALFAQMWTLSPSLTCLFKVAEPRLELRALAPDSPGQKQLLARLLNPCPLIASHPFPLYPHPHSSPGRHS